MVPPSLSIYIEKLFSPISDELSYDAAKEHLGKGDGGVILFRQLLEAQIKIVEDGGEPINTFRDPNANQSIDTMVEKPAEFFARLSGSGVDRTLGARKYSPIYREATRRIEGEEALSRPISGDRGSSRNR